jgi:perosamine synthetase
MKPFPSPLDVVQAVRDVRPWRRQVMLPFEANEDDCAAALRCVQDEPVGQGGLLAFERGLERATGLPCAVGVASGTAALELALRAVGVGPGDQVIVPAMTFAGAAAAVIHCGATPRFVDCLYSPPGAIAWFKLDRHLRILSGRERLSIKAVVTVDLFGQPSVTPELANLCEEFGLAVVEDAAQALGSEIGRNARVATLSFNCNKIVTTTGGGAVLTSDPELAERVRHLATTARRPSEHHYDYDEVGHNYRLSNVLATLGLSQLGRLDEIKRKKHALAVRYSAALRRVAGYKFVEHPANSNAWLNCVLVDPPHDDGAIRDDALEALSKAGLGCRALFTPLHMVEPYKHCPRQRDLGIAEDLFYRAVCLPSGVEP